MDKSEIKTLDKSEIAKVNEKIKSVNNNKTFKIKLFETYKVLILNSKSVEDLKKYGFSELNTTYLSSKKYSETVIDILIKALKNLDYICKD